MVEWIRNWVITICIAVIFSTAVELILPSDKFKKYVQFVMGLILMAVILNPIIKLVNNNQDLSVYINNANKYIQNTANTSDLSKYKEEDKDATLSAFKLNLEKTVVQLLKSKFPQNDYSVTANVKMNDETNGVDILGLSVSIKNSGIKQIEKIKINSASVNSNKDQELNDERSKEIKNYLNDQLKISTSNIQVFKS